MFTATVETDCGDLLLLLAFLRAPNAFWGGACHAEEVPSQLPTADAMSPAESASWMMTLDRFMVCFRSFMLGGRRFVRQRYEIRAGEQLFLLNNMLTKLTIMCRVQ